MYIPLPSENLVVMVAAISVVIIAFRSTLEFDMLAPLTLFVAAISALVALISFFKMLPERTPTTDRYEGPVELIVMTLLVWALVYGITTDSGAGRNWTPRSKRAFRVASLPLAFIATFAGLAFISGDQTNATLVSPTLRLLNLH